MATLKALKLLPNNTKYTTFGYVRRMEKESFPLNIPAMITYLILKYYFHGEYFEKAGDDLEISDDKMSVTRITSPGSFNRFMNTAYGKTWINGNSDQIIRWRFKIESYGEPISTIFVGIVSNDHRLNEDFANYEDKQWRYFGITKLLPMKQYNFIFDTLDWELRIETDDHVVVREDSAPFPKDNTRYKLALSMTSKTARFTTIDFGII